MHINKNLNYHLCFIRYLKKRESQGSYFTQQKLRHQGHFYRCWESRNELYSTSGTVFQRCVTERPHCRRVQLFRDLEKQKLHLWSIGRVRLGGGGTP